MHKKMFTCKLYAYFIINDCISLINNSVECLQIAKTEEANNVYLQITFLYLTTNHLIKCTSKCLPTNNVNY